MQRGRNNVAPVRRRPPVEGLFCTYSHRVCMQNRLDGYDYCMRHILEDKTSPYRQCNYTSTRTGKRCPNAAPKADKKDGSQLSTVKGDNCIIVNGVSKCGSINRWKEMHRKNLYLPYNGISHQRYCQEHGKLMIAYRHRMCQKRRPKDTAETIINDLSRYAEKNDSTDEKAKSTDQGIAVKVLEYGSSDDSDNEALRVEQVWRGEVESDAESVDSEQEDLLKHAGVYTAEEVALITRDKLIRLQSLYIEQFKRLQHVMKERRRAYLQASRQDKDLVSLSSYENDPKSRQNYFKLLALRKYHQRHGKEALLHRQSKERRIAVSDSFNYRPPLFSRCIEMVSGVKCTNRVLPLSKYCMKHIISDHNQVLYHECAFSECSRPAMDTSGDDPVCVYHTCLRPPALIPEVEAPPVDASSVERSGSSAQNEQQLIEAMDVGAQTSAGDVTRDGIDEVESLLDPLDLDHMTWSVSDSSLSSTISRLTSSLGPLASLPANVGNLDTSVENSADEQPELTS